METMVVKNEENVGRWRMCVANGEAEGTRSVKRRRRDTTVAALSNSDDIMIIIKVIRTNSSCHSNKLTKLLVLPPQ